MQLDQAALAEIEIGPLPEAFFRRLSELFMVTSNWHVFPDVVPALEELKERGLVIGAVSNWVWQLPELLHALDLVPQFDFIAASSRIGFEKPHPEIFRWALEQAHAEPDEVIHVGDHLDADVQGSAGTGIEPVLIDRWQRFTTADLPPNTSLLIRQSGRADPDRRRAAPRAGRSLRWTSAGAASSASRWGNAAGRAVGRG